MATTCNDDERRRKVEPQNPNPNPDEREPVEVTPLKLFETSYHFDRVAEDMTFVPELVSVDGEEGDEDSDPKDSPAPASAISQYYEATRTRLAQELLAADVPVDEGNPDEFESGKQASSSTAKPSSGKSEPPA
jgi:hypothetical protein